METEAKSEPLPEAVTWYGRVTRIRTSSFSAPPLNEASRPLHFSAQSAHLGTSRQEVGKLHRGESKKEYM